MRRAPPRRVAAAAAAAAAALPEGEGGQPVDIRDAGSGRVWRVALGSGRLLALKLASAQAPLGGELRTLRWLAQRAAPVPAVLAADGAPQPDWLALEWCGDSTLDDALQGAAAPGAVTPGAAGRGAAAGDAGWGEGGKRLVRAVAALAGAFWPLRAGARRRPEWDQQVAALRAQAGPWLAAAPQALAWLLQGRTGGGAGEGDGADALRRTVALALEGEPDVGSLDYNARNVVLDEAGGRVTLVDFAATGVDWP
ncbi:MAG TPA: phosphotransferase, partial [Chloroflexota bacterium]|nr:phosphotransferase [Chloroflexota bacterium]